MIGGDILKVDRAVFLAAGLGSRLKPVTDEVPKPLVKIRGKSIIESSIEAAIQAGIEEIYLVLGYKFEAFDVILKKYPMCKAIINSDYREANNISSICCAGDLLRNAYIIEGDLWVKNPKIIAAEQEHSNYVSIPLKKTDDWCFYTDEHGFIKKMAIGGENCEQMVGVSYWTEDDGKRLSERAVELYKEKGNRKLYWDQVALEKFLPEFEIRTRNFTFDDVIEIDTMEELCAVDETYEKYKIN